MSPQTQQTWPLLGPPPWCMSPPRSGLGPAFWGLCCTRGGCGPGRSRDRQSVLATSTADRAREDLTPQGAPVSPCTKGCTHQTCPKPTEPRWPHQKQVPLSQLGLPTTPPSCPQLHSSYLWSVELQIWELLSFQVSITQETAVLKCISPLQACYPTTPLILPGLQLSPTFLPAPGPKLALTATAHAIHHSSGLCNAQQASTQPN